MLLSQNHRLLNLGEAAGIPSKLSWTGGAYSELRIGADSRLIGGRCRAVSPPIGQPLADDATDRAFGALTVGDPQRHAVAIAEIELGKVAVQVLFTAMLI